MGAKDLVIQGTIPISMTTDIANNLRQQALLVMIQLVTEPIMAQLANLTSAYEMWAFLKENYYTDTSFSFVHQMQKIFALQDSFDTKRPIGDFIRTYEQDWTRLLLLTSNSSSSVSSKYRTLMKQVLE